MDGVTLNEIAQITHIPTTMLLAILVTFAVWSVCWKGIALWISARRDDKYWFIALLLINTLGLLDIIYIYKFSKSAQTKGQL